MNIQPRVSTKGAARTPEEIVLEMAQAFEGKMPEVMRSKEAHPETFKIVNEEMGTIVSLGVFVKQEIDRFNILITVMKESLANLQKAIKGTLVMSMELEHMFNNFIDNRVPKMWEDVGYPSLKPLNSWFEDF